MDSDPEKGSTVHRGELPAAAGGRGHARRQGDEGGVRRLATQERGREVGRRDRRSTTVGSRGGSSSYYHRGNPAVN